MKTSLLAALCTVIVGCSAPQPPATPPSASTLTATPVAASSSVATSLASTSPSGVAPACRTAQLGITVVHAGGAAGTVGGYLRFTNTSREPCSLHGWPTLVGVTVAGTTTTARQTNAVLTFPNVVAPPTVTLDPGAVAYAAFAGSDNPGLPTRTCAPSFLSLRVTPPGNTDDVVLSAFNPGFNDFLPDCSGIEVTMVVAVDSDLSFLDPTPTPTLTVLGGCGATPVFAGPGPDAVPGPMEVPGLSDLRWATASPSSAGIVAYIWRPQPDVLVVKPSPAGPSNKILWMSRGDVPGNLVITAHPVGSSLPVVRFTLPGEGRQYPSEIDLTARGCWRLDLTIGSMHATIDLPVAP